MRALGGGFRSTCGVTAWRAALHARCVELMLPVAGTRPRTPSGTSARAGRPGRLHVARDMQPAAVAATCVPRAPRRGLGAGSRTGSGARLSTCNAVVSRAGGFYGRATGSTAGGEPRAPPAFIIYAGYVALDDDRVRVDRALTEHLMCPCRTPSRRSYGNTSRPRLGRRGPIDFSARIAYGGRDSEGRAAASAAWERGAWSLVI